MQNIKLSLIAAAFLATSNISYAVSMSLPNGWYLEPNAGYAVLSNKSYPGSVSTSDFGYNVNLGYKIYPYIAAEIGYTGYGTATIDALNIEVAKDRFYSFDIAARGIVPIPAWGIEGFAKVGVVRVASRVSIESPPLATAIGMSSKNNTSDGLFIDAGVQYVFSPSLATNVQWARAYGNSSTGTHDLISLGISYLTD